MHCSGCQSVIDQAFEHFHLAYFGGGGDAVEHREWFCSADCVGARLLD